MPDAWIGTIRLTNETEILDDKGVKIHEYVSCDQGAGVAVDILTHPSLHTKLGGGSAELPDIPTPAGSPCPYKIIADAT